MLKLVVISAVFACALAGVIHEDFGGHGGESETDHHHEVEHKHATSHQSFKVHHYHPVPVYVKKEDQHFLKHPVEVSGVKHKLKVLHPETEHSHNHGLTIENHSEFEDHKLHGGHGGDFHGFSHDESSLGGGFEHYGGGGDDGDHGGHEFHDINVGHHHE
ncbi:histidine-rich glycoprotein-like [Phlebotomus argentipes]|uniref:histidine-rich glycoprotein-like n=1 Tax=Phlebotomus argentipes TaxID=94469 RepID=UPI0028930DA0|nr:histidine-rich glycoprotein-like [Phlebotomus argentipes]